jgi:hypothetical protein
MLRTKTFVIGDVHGCIDELQELMQKLSPSTHDRLIFIGDLIDKGPNSVAVVRAVVQWSRQLKVQLILGNHEEKFLRYVQHIRAGSGNEKEMQGIEEFPNLLQGLGDEEMRFLEGAYYTLHLPEWNALLVHGGLWKSIDFPLPASYGFIDNHQGDKKRLALLTMTRYLNAAGKFVVLGQEKAGDIFWAEEYDGQWGHVFFGHQPFIQSEPAGFPHATGIDTGCVFGGWLSAVEITEEAVKSHSVQARQTYVTPK